MKKVFTLWACFVVIGATGVVFILSKSGEAHEPITTNVRFNKEVVRILARNCLACHRSGGVAPMSLQTYEEARPWAKAIEEELLAKHMPPWAAVKGYGQFRNQPSLTQHEVDLIVSWVNGGVPKGSPEDLPHEPLLTNNWEHGEPSLILDVPVPRRLPPRHGLHQTTLLMIKPAERGRWLKAIDFKAGRGAVVHCASFYLVKQALGGERLLLATWIPGQAGAMLPDGIARKLSRSSRILVDVHYQSVGEESNTSEQPRVGLYFNEKSPLRSVQNISLRTLNKLSRALSGAIKISYTVTRNLDLWAIRPLPQKVFTSIEATAYRPDGSVESLIWVRDDKSKDDWQPLYYFTQPVFLPKGTRVVVTAYPFSPTGNFAGKELCQLMTANTLSSSATARPE